MFCLLAWAKLTNISDGGGFWGRSPRSHHLTCGQAFPQTVIFRLAGHGARQCCGSGSESGSFYHQAKIKIVRKTLIRETWPGSSLSSRRAPRQTCQGRGANLRPPQADALPKELSRQLISWLFGASIWPSSMKTFGPLHGRPSAYAKHMDLNWEVGRIAFASDAPWMYIRH